MLIRLTYISWLLWGLSLLSVQLTAGEMNRAPHPPIIDGIDVSFSIDAPIKSKVAKVPVTLKITNSTKRPITVKLLHLDAHIRFFDDNGWRVSWVGPLFASGYITVTVPPESSLEHRGSCSLGYFALSDGLYTMSLYYDQRLLDFWTEEKDKHPWTMWSQSQIRLRVRGSVVDVLGEQPVPAPPR